MIRLSLETCSGDGKSQFIFRDHGVPWREVLDRCRERVGKSARSRKDADKSCERNHEQVFAHICTVYDNFFSLTSLFRAWTFYSCENPRAVARGSFDLPLVSFSSTAFLHRSCSARPSCRAGEGLSCADR